jgi:hypothetical protein
MAARRYLCSHLVTLSWSGGERVVNLEEIWETGAVLECDEPVSAGVLAEIRCGNTFFAGRTTLSEAHDFGWRVEMEFSPMTPWSRERFLPDHLLDLSETGTADSPSESP